MSKLVPALLALVTAAGLVAACGDAPTEPVTEPPASTVDTIEIVGANVELAPGDSVQLVARARDANGQIVDGRTFTWSTDDPGVATVSDDGLVTAIAAGEVVVAAETADVSGGVILVVADHGPATVARVELAPGDGFQLSAGETLQLAATAYGADGQELAGRALTWSTSDAGVVSVSATGLVTALAAGQATIEVLCEGQRDQVVVEVPTIVDPPIAVDHVTLDYLEILLPVGDTMQLVATPRDAQGQPLAREITWTSNNPDYVIVSGTGLVTSLQVGGADITATSGGKSASVRVYATGTTSHTLTALGGHALPSLLGSYSEAQHDGSTYTRTLRVFDGWMVIDHTSRTYEVVVSATMTTASQPSSVPIVVQYESQGSLELDPATGVYTFQPMLGDAFTGQWVTGAMQVQWQPEARIAGASTFLFTSD